MRQMLRIQVAMAGLLMATSSCGYGQDRAAVRASEAACGPSETEFQVATVSTGTGVAMPVGEGVIYLIETPWAPTVTLRAAMDGRWKGAIKPGAFIAIPVPPGQHHMCVQWQSRLHVISNHLALSSTEVAAGHAYYFLADLAHPLGENQVRLTLLDPDEGQDRLARSQIAVAQVKPAKKK